MRSITILAVDGDLDNLIVLEALIKKALKEVTFVDTQSGSEVFELCLVKKPDLIFIDISILEKDNYKICQILKSDAGTKSIPIVALISGNTEKSGKSDALKMGADAFLSKPVDESEMAIQVRSMLRLNESEHSKPEENERLKRMVAERTEALEKNQLEMGKLLEELKAEIEQRKKTETALRESEERFVNLFERVPLGYQSLDENGCFIEVNEAWRDTLGYSREEVLGKWFGDFLAPEYVDAFRKRFPVFKALGQIHSEFEMVHKSGEYRFISFEGRVGRKEDGNFEKTHCIIRDITDQKMADKALRESEEKYRKMVDLLPDAVIIHAEGKVVFANDAAFRLVGATSADQLLNKPALDFVHPDDRNNVLSRIQQVYETHEPSGYSEERFINLNNEVFWGEVIGIPVSYMGKPAIQTIVRDINERKRAGIALQEQKNEFETIFNLVPAQIWYKDTHNKIIRVNQRVCQDIGLPCSELEGRDTEELFPEFAGQFYADDLEVIRSGKPKIGIIEQINTASGELRWHHTNKVPVFSEAGEVKGIIAFALDITKSKQDEDALRAGRERWENLFNNSPSSIAIYQAVDGGNDFVFTDFNLAAQKIDNIKREDVIGRRISEMFPGAYELGFLDVFRRVWKTGKTEHISSSYYKDSRIEGWRENIIYRLNTGEIVAIYEDVSDRKRAENALKERNSFIQTVLDNLPIGISLNDIDEGIATYMNKKFEEIYGWNLDEMNSINMFFEHVYPDPEYRNQIVTQVLTDIQSGDPGRMHWENIFVTRKDGSQRVVNAVNIPLLVQNTMVSTVMDITDLHKSKTELVIAKEKAEEADRLKSAFLANMSHEIRTPLNSIIGFSELMTDEYFDIDQQLHFARMINTSGNQLLSIISDIMDFSKIETGQIVVQKSRISVNRIIRDILREFSYRVIDKGIELRPDPANPVEEIFIESDEVKIRQILNNLVGNAIKFTNEGYVEIGISASDDTIYFHVKDTGIGIPSEFHDSIFERFRQIEPALNRKYGGNGLGLAISKSLVEMLGGKIWIESQTEQGSTFFFSLPR